MVEIAVDFLCSSSFLFTFSPSQITKTWGQKTSSDVTYPKRYYFNQSSQTCESFHFTGMLAHGNNFPTLAACNTTCLFVPNIEAIRMPESTEPRRKQQQSEDHKQQQQLKQQQLSWSDRQTSVTEKNRPSPVHDGEPTLDDGKKPKYPVIGVNVMNKTSESCSHFSLHALLKIGSKIVSFLSIDWFDIHLDRNGGLRYDEVSVLSKRVLTYIDDLHLLSPSYRQYWGSFDHKPQPLSGGG